MPKDPKGPKDKNIKDQTTQNQTADKETLVLVGLMGAGKSCIGRRLASQLGMTFVDADSEIEAAAGCSIEEIFENHGEDAFREGERRVIARLLETPGLVLATGGGAFMDSQTRATIKATARSIWLRADLDLLVKRTGRRNNRPLLKKGDPREILKNLIDRRYPIYAEADLTVDSTDGPPEATVNRVVKALKSLAKGLDDKVAASGSKTNVA